MTTDPEAPRVRTMNFSSPTEEEWLESVPDDVKICHYQHQLEQLRASNEWLMKHWAPGNADRIDINDDEKRHIEEKLKQLQAGANQ